MFFRSFIFWLGVLFGFFWRDISDAFGAEEQMPVTANIVQCTLFVKSDGTSCIYCPGITDYTNSQIPECDAQTIAENANG